MTQDRRAHPSPATARSGIGFLDTVTGGDAELQAYLQRMAGYCLTGVTTEHALFFLYGTGANGKSVFANTLTAILGDYAMDQARQRAAPRSAPRRSGAPLTSR